MNARHAGLVSMATGALFTLFGLALATPIQGPGYEPSRGVTAQEVGRIVVAITRARVNRDRAARRAFWSYVDEVENSLVDQPGFIGFSKRRELIGNQAWTMTLWSDEASLNAFVRSPAHRAAMRSAGRLLEGASFVRFGRSVAAGPLKWSEALAQLEESGRGYDYGAVAQDPSRY